ncbi:MAG: peptidoglycan editing factor PgeF [Lachnospiraceae bacterium]|nr:peptidoglycan editing factor PgeF [Lachnospiraceae bacterium]
MRLHTIEPFENTGLVSTFFTTKEDTHWKQGTPKMAENYETLAVQFGLTTKEVVGVYQTHTSNIKIVTKANGGETILRPEAETGFDGMITNEPGLLLCTKQADCVPVYLLDPEQKAIAMIHSGWKGTAGTISVNGVRLMEQTYGSKPEHILVALGPCICGDCYEVSDDLIVPFSVRFSKSQIEQIFLPGKKAGKYYLNLPLAIRLSLLEAGLKNENIFNPPFCTLHSKEADGMWAFPSYRRDHRNDERMLTGIMLK